ncbi:MAG TPA: pentapeptide repeat-containing protein [Gemmataceae bacterium]|nr:pentapeptide repeat-containing protein [Gemmataceae bacterium]
MARKKSAPADLKAVLTAATNPRRHDFRGADLTGIALDKRDLQGIDLSGADLYSSDLRGADLSTARLDGTKLDGAILDEDTRFPKGFPLPKFFKWKGQGSPPKSS